MEGLRRIVRDRDRRVGLVQQARAAKERAPKPPWERESPSAETKRIVWKRDQGRCQAKLATGGICGSTRKLEFHHIVEHARGGPTTTENLSLRCKAHNLQAAEETFGKDFMARFTEPALST
jgi:5-methylcytosine-specific restriction endonuclease McrA